MSGTHTYIHVCLCLEVPNFSRQWSVNANERTQRGNTFSLSTLSIEMSEVLGTHTHMYTCTCMQINVINNVTQHKSSSVYIVNLAWKEISSTKQIITKGYKVQLGI